MSVVANRKITITFEGDLAGTQEYEAAQSDDGPGVTNTNLMNVGNTTVVAPADTGKVATAVTIIKPSDYDGVITLKGDAADTGVKLHPTDPDTISLDPTYGQIVIHVTVQVALRFVWT